MLKRISVRQLTVGMHLKEFCGSWMEHPFWRTGFVIKNPKDIEAILASSIQEVWIDTDKGLDVEASVKAVPKVEVEAEVDKTLSQVGQYRPVPQPVSREAEMERAARICREGKQAVVSMFAEVRLGNAVDSAAAKELVQDISDSVTRNPGALISLARLKTADDYTYMHSLAVCAMMVALSKQLGLDEARTRSAGLAGLLHDLGKAFVPIKILNKPGTLTPQEFGVMKGHPVEGHRALQRSGNVDPVALDVCLHHHEKVDGSGYPKGLKGDDISLFAKMGAVCDVYDAITSNRPYKTGWDPAESLRKMAEWSKGHFDPAVFQAFVKSMGIYPVGSLVMMASGRIGVVTEQGTKSLTTPKVKLFFSTKSNLRIPPVVIDLSRPDVSDRIASREDPAKWRFPDINALWSGIDDIRDHH
ncbi:MAG: HD-GYP domain-containing protein [Rhodoferax sp.]|nr:HD-GYP domain-containing protein [Rhodoferax sp.]